MRLEQLPAVGRPRKPVKPPPVTSTAQDEHLEELPPAREAEEPLRANRRAAAAENRPDAHISVHPMRELLDLAASGRPAVAVEDGVYRVQPHAYGGGPGRDPGLRRLAAAVTGGAADAGDPAGGEVDVGSEDGDALQVTGYGIEMDAFLADARGDEQTGTRGGPLDRLARRVDAVGAALLVRGRHGGYRPRQIAGILGRAGARLAFADEDPVAARYLTRRVALIVEDPLHAIPGLGRRFAASARDRIGCLSFLPARAGGRAAYLMLAGAHGAEGAGAWNLQVLVRRLRLVRDAGTGGRPPP
ncbi:MAG: hypothetical protein OXQ31_19860 [Spirochaetaceae bacterium]|nr:hypothetical protein [Spirochaetaceae bacterium]